MQRLNDFGRQSDNGVWQFTCDFLCTVYLAAGVERRIGRGKTAPWPLATAPRRGRGPKTWTASPGALHSSKGKVLLMTFVAELRASLGWTWDDGEDANNNSLDFVQQLAEGNGDGQPEAVWRLEGPVSTQTARP